MTKRKRDWHKVKRSRDPLPRILVLHRSALDCIVLHNGCKFCFWSDLPLEEKLTWKSVHGMRVDDRLPPQPPQFELLPPLRKPDRATQQQAKMIAFAVLKEERAKALFARDNPELFDDLPVMLKPRGKSG